VANLHETACFGYVAYVSDEQVISLQRFIAELEYFVSEIALLLLF
jgi:hypothetical protein